MIHRTFFNLQLNYLQTIQRFIVNLSYDSDTSQYEEDMGGSVHRNTAKNINEHRITARKVNETPSPQHVFSLTVSKPVYASRLLA